MQWKSGATATYAVTQRDTSSANFDNELPTAYDTIIRTITAVNQFYLGISNVTVYRDSSTRTRKSTVGRMYQDADGAVRIWDWAQPIWSVYFGSYPLSDEGWVEYAGPTSSTASMNWSTYFNIGRFVGNFSTDIYDQGKLQTDEDVKVQGIVYNAKHILHTITPPTEGFTTFFTIYIESDLVYDLGMPVVEIVHTYNDWIQKGHYGTTARMISHSN